VSIHGHTDFSPYDGFGHPAQHINFCLNNQLDGWALTDHGNGNGLAHAHAHAKKIIGNGQKFRQLFGVEFYFVPSLENWRKGKVISKAEKDGTRLGLGDDAGLVVEDVGESRIDNGLAAIGRRYHLVVVAKNAIGLSNLFTLVKRSFSEGFYRFPRIDFEMLKQHSEGLIVSTACVSGYPSGIITNEFPDLKFDQLHPSLVDDPKLREKICNNLENMVDRFVDCVGFDNFFLELQFNGLNAQDLTNRCVLAAAKKSGARLVSTADSHFPDPNMWEAREIYRHLLPGRIKPGEDVIQLPKKEDMKTMLYPKNAQQMWDEYLNRREKFDWYQGTEDMVRISIENGHDIAWQSCEQIWFDTSAKLPSFDRPDKSAFVQLSDAIKQALIDEGLADNKEYVSRAVEELGDIKFLGFENYFLTLQKVMKLAENQTLPGAGRGSGAGSLVNYLLGITHVDPLKYDLLWARFLGRHRKGWPDIDVDVGDRDELIAAARKSFGVDSVIPVSNFNTLKLKSLVKDISKFYGIPFLEVNQVTGPLEKEVEMKSRDPDMEKSMFVLKHEDCMKYSSAYQAFMKKYPKVEDHVKTLFMMNRSVGRHAGGVLICPDLEKHMPLIKVRGELQTPWTEGVNIRNLEENGFLKFDFLGLKQMKMVESCIHRILKKQLNRKPTFAEIKKFYDDKLNCRYVEANDSKVFDNVYKQGKWSGIFQFTGSGARAFCLQAQPDNIIDLAAITAIYRPGPLKANVHKKYVQAKANPSEVQYEHPIVEEVLGPTYGFIVFQEQFMVLAQKLAGFTAGESDDMRKTLVKKDLTSLGKKTKEKELLEIKFVEGCVSLSGMNREVAQQLFDKIAYFSLYGFNMSHAIAYAIDSYYGAWLHTYYENEWLATVLQSENGNPKGQTKIIAEIKSHGFEFSKIDVNYSGDVWTFSDKIKAFVPPLSSVKGIGAAAMAEIIRLRPYASLLDMFYDTDGVWKHSKMNKACLTSLCKIEALGSLQEFEKGEIYNHRQLLDALLADKNYEILRRGIHGLTPAQFRKTEKAGGETEVFLRKILDDFSATEDWTRAEKVDMSFELTSTVDGDLLFPAKLMSKIAEKNIASIHTIPDGVSGVGWFMITDVIKKKTKNGKTFYRLKVSDNENQVAWLRVWGELTQDPEKYTLWMAHVSSDPNWGMSSSVAKLRRIA